MVSLYLWHQAALTVAARLVLPLGYPDPQPGTPAWWVARLLWLVLPGIVLAADLAAEGAIRVDPHVAELGRLGVVQVLGHLLVHAFDLVFTARQGEHCHYHSQFAHACTSRFEGADSSMPTQGKDRDHTLHPATATLRRQSLARAAPAH